MKRFLTLRSLRAVLLAFFLPAWLSAQSITAGFQPDMMSVGNVGNYVITLQNINTQSLPNIQLPPVPGLKVIGLQPSVSQSTQIFNGYRTNTIELTWQVIAQQAGSLTMPGQKLQIGGQTYNVPQSTLTVAPESQRDKERFRCLWDLPEKPFYVGEAIPAFLKVYVRGDIRASRPTRSWELDDGLLAKTVEEPDIIREEVNGTIYNVAVWSVVLTPIRPDSFNLEALAEIVYEDPENPRYTTDFFRRRLVQDRKVLVTPPYELIVKEVPKGGRLEGYNGAVGSFEISATTDIETLKAGEPLTLNIVIDGTGNFDRIAAPVIPDTPGWRVYPPKVTFEAGDALNYTGKKTFSYLLIPADESIVATPAIPFASFDPYQETFEDLSIEPKSIAVEPAPTEGVSMGFPLAGNQEPSSRPLNTWRPFKAELGALTSGVRPVVRSPLFIAVQAGMALLVVGILGWRWQRNRFLNDEGYARRISASKAVRQSLKVASEKAAKNETEAFFVAAQRTVQEAVSKHLPRSQRSGSLTLNEISHVLKKANAPDSVIEEIAKLLQDAEAMRYAGSSQQTNASLKDCLARLEKIIRAIP
jgi:hypothetical protein